MNIVPFGGTILNSYQNITRSNPLAIIPEFNAVVMKDLTKVLAFVKLTNVKSSEIHFQQKLNVCTLSDKPVVGIFLKPFIAYLGDYANFDLRCPFKKDTKLQIKKFSIGNHQVTSLLPTETERTFSLMIKGGKKNTPMFSFTFFIMRIEIDE